jgi:hypothetical protein
MSKQSIECLTPTPTTLMPMPLCAMLTPSTRLRWSSISAGVMGIGIVGVETPEIEEETEYEKAFVYRSPYVVSRPIRIPLQGIVNRCAQYK